MAVNVLIPTALRQYADGEGTIQLEGDHVGAILGSIGEKYPKLKPHLFTDDGHLRNFVNVYVNDEDIRYQESVDTTLNDGDEITIVPAVAGGSVSETPDTQSTKSDTTELSKEEVERYSRHLIMPEVALKGQKKLKAASVLLIGTGGLGSPLAMYLGAAGVGRIGLVDFDVVDRTNLQRQVIHSTAKIGRSKLESAREFLADLNPNVQVDTYETMITSANALDLIRPYDIVIDGTDNFPTRYLVNDACVMLGKPNIYGSIFRFEGQATLFDPPNGPCYRCLYPEPPPPGLVPSCAEGGVLGILPGTIGIIQATEAVKRIIGQGESLSGRLLLYNALDMSFRQVKVRKDPECPVCGENPSVTELIDYNQFCGIGGGEDVVKLDSDSEEISVTELKQLVDAGIDIRLIDVREPHEYDICDIGGQLIPLGTLEQNVHHLDRNDDIIVHCRSGVRSAKATKFLKEAGFNKVRNVVGGILAWADEVDPEMPKY
jgi:sulfur-carrier protein adenylyltransferase/sulfurtransferase